MFNDFRVMRPEGDEAKELQEIVAKRQKKGKVDDDKPLEEKSIFHSEFIALLCILLFIFRFILITQHGKDSISDHVI